MSLKSKIFIGISISILVVFTIFSLYTFGETSKVIMGKEMEALDLLSMSIDMEMEEQLESAQLSVTTMANNKEVQRAFSEKDREALKAMVLPVYDSLSDKMTQIQFHLPDSTSFLRLHSPEKFGDSLKDFRFTVNQANESREIVRGLEEGVAGYGFRVVYPISYEGNHIGTVEYGSDFGKGFLEGLKENYTGEFYTYEFEADAASVIDGTMDEDQWQIEDASILSDIKNGEIVHKITENGRDNILLMPFKNYNGEVKGYFKIVQDRTELVQSINSIRRNSIIYTGILLVVLLSAFYVFLNYSLNPINNLVEAADRVASGNLKEDIEIRTNDEIGRLAESFNKMMAGLRVVIGESDEISGRVAATSQELSAAAEEVTAASEEVANSMLHVSELASDQMQSVENSSETMDNMLESMDQVSNNIERINISSQNTLISAEEGIKSSEAAVNRMGDLKDSTNKTSEEIKILNQSSKEIENIVRVIGDIADQTNLLALNAAIEAARAGEAGAGFAVVAEEVKQLAEQSSNSTEQIAKIVVDIQEQINSAVSSIDSSSKDVESGVQVVVESGNKFSEILENINDVVKEIEMITSLIYATKEDAGGIRGGFDQISKLSQDTARDSEDVSASSEEQSAAMEQVASSSIELSNMASELLDAISVFEY